VTAPTGLMQDIVAELSDDGDEVEVGAWTLRLTVAPDEWADVMADMKEGEWYGRGEWAEWVHYSTTHYDGHYTRPEWADGAAELLRPHFTDPMWWRPADDVVKDRELRDRMRRSLLELLEFGYSVVTVEAFRHRDIYGKGCVEAVASIGGVEPGDDGPGVIGDVVAEVLAQIGGDAE
jgi:hypothetical protein